MPTARFLCVLHATFLVSLSLSLVARSQETPPAQPANASQEDSAASPADQPPADQPPADQPPADQPPADPQETSKPTQANATDATQPLTTSDPEISLASLNILLRPLNKKELMVEGQAWLELLREKIREVGAVELEVKRRRTEKIAPEQNDKLTEQLIALRTAEAQLADRARAVQEALKIKGGDVEESQQFINAVSSIKEATDATSYWAAIVAIFTSWMARQDGGQLWIKRVVAALLILAAAWLISRFAGHLLAKGLNRYSRTSQLLENFARRTMGGLVLILGVLMALSALGVQIGPMMAALGAGGFIVGFALQETLGSFASGMMIMIYRPFDVDDYVAVAGVEGTVKEMSLVSTTLLTVDNKVLVIPNTKAWGDTIVNYTGRDIRRVDLVFGIGYDDNIQQATEVLRELTSQHMLVLDTPTVNVGVDKLDESSVNLFCRPWVKTSDYWTVRWDLLRQTKERFDAEGISIPFPQRDVHMQSEPTPASHSS